MLLQDRVVIVTGSTTGIGRSIAIACAREGARVVVHGRDEERAAQVAAGLGGEAAVVTSDLAEPAGAERVVGFAVERFGRVDALVNNAALTTRADLAASSAEVFDRIIAVNLRAPLLLIRAAMPHFRAAGRGAVLNIGSINAYAGARELLPYSISKGGLMTLTRNLADAHAHEHVRVNQLNVGWTLTENEDALHREAGLPAGWHDRVPAGLVPTGRLLTPDEVAAHVVFWVSDASAPTTGAVYEVEQYPIIGRNPPKAG
jgi:NAD(P)-dependent dehydrogenase (short-subunit alcohol dehydrogenase family)